jgi:PAS domain S-box-containing protein
MDVLGETTGQLLEAQRIAGCGSYVFDVTTGFWTGSEVLSDIFGLPEPGLTRDANGWLEIVHPEDRETMHGHLYEDVLKNHSPFDRTYRIIRRNDQQERWVHGLGKLIFNENGEVTRMVGIIQDITDRKRNEDQMNVQFSALTAAANAILITDRSGRIEWVNPAFSKLTGYSAEEAVGKTPQLLNSGQHAPAFFANLWQTVLAGNVWHGEMVNRRKDGGLYTEDTTITPVRNADGQVAHFVSIKQDVTERRQLEKRMLQAQKMEAIGTLAGGIAHDFNNILAAMFGYAYLLQQDTEGNAAAQENIEEILKATGRAKDLVQQILTFSRQREQKPQVVRLDSIVKEAVRFLRASLPSQIKIELNLAADAPAVLADPTQIYQVVINLATNALHAMEGRAGRLTIALESFPTDTHFLQLHPNFRPGLGTLLTVADTGQGMDVKTMERIFEPFFTTKPVGKGTGLGLSVVHGIVESHQGAISVDSKVGCGTTFRLYFPGQEDAITLKEEPIAKVPAGNGQHVLLLDDEPTLTTALERLLIRLNYQVSISNSAREAIHRFAEAPVRYDLVITDLTMPEMSGLEVSRQLRQLRPDLPVILTSGFSADVNHETLAAAGICEVLPKPISWNDLADILHRVLSRSPAANGLAGK